MLQCPKCKGKLHKEEKVYACDARHSFDIAKSGYCNLLLDNRKSTGDDRDMIRSRTAFLLEGHYAPLKERIIEILSQLFVHTLVDAGCGEGYYTNDIKRRIPSMDVWGFDLSKSAVAAASKQKSGVHYFVASVSDLPLKCACTDAVLSIFAPVYEEENYRILKPAGYFLKVEPGPQHLLDLKKVLYDTVYENEAAAMSYPHFRLAWEEMLDYEIHISSGESIRSLFRMTPYYWKTSREATQRLYARQCLTTRVQFHLELYQKER